MCFCIAAFDTDTFQCTMLCQKELALSSFWWYDYFLCRINIFRVIIVFLRDDNAYPVFCKTFRFSGLSGGHV